MHYHGIECSQYIEQRDLENMFKTWQQITLKAL